MRLTYVRGSSERFFLHLVFLGTAAWLVAGCGGGGSTTPTAGGTCTLSSDCQDSLVCTSGRCHAQCAQSRDCDFGQRCVKIGTNYVCQLQSEAKCVYNSDCASPLVCAVDLQCRAQCQADRDCTKGQVCTPITKVCAETTELNASGDLSAVVATTSSADGGASSGGSSDGGGSSQVDAPLATNAGAVTDFENAWKTAVTVDAGATGLDGGTVIVQVLPTPAPTASATTLDPPRIVLVGSALAGSTLQLQISYESDNAIASIVVAPVGATYFTRIYSSEPKTTSHPLQFALSLALPENLAQLSANGLTVQMNIALVDALAHVSNVVTIAVQFQRTDGGVSATTSSGKVCAWGQPATCLPDGTGLLACAVDELSIQVIDCQTGPPAFKCQGGADGGAAECVCPNTCALLGKSCGQDPCGHDCGDCATGAECDPLGNCRDRAKNGCADGTREGFTDATVYPTIAACEVWWDGNQSLRTARTGQEWCGNSTGIKCTAPADGCAPGWHMCMQGGWPADIRDRKVNTLGVDGGNATLSSNDCLNANQGHSFLAASSSAYPASQGGSCTAPPFGCYAEDVGGYIDTVACGSATNTDSCNNAIWPNATRGIGPWCGTMAIIRTDQNGILCCQDPEITGS